MMRSLSKVLACYLVGLVCGIMATRTFWYWHYKDRSAAIIISYEKQLRRLEKNCVERNESF